MSITCVFRDKKEHDLYCEEVAEVKKLKIKVEMLRNKVLGLEEEQRKAILSPTCESESFTTDNMIKASELIMDKVIDFKLKHNKDVEYSNLYACCFKKLSDEFPGLNKSMVGALWRSAWKYSRQTGKLYMEKKTKKVIMNEVNFGGVAVNDFCWYM